MTADLLDAWALAIETSQPAGSVALGQGEAVFAARTLDRPRRHATDLLPAVADLVQSAGVQPRDVRVVYVSAGPGSFTGLRIGITVARTLALAHGAAVVPVPSLDVIAQNALTPRDPPAQLLVSIDAQRGRLFAARYQLAEDEYVRMEEPREADPADLFAAQSASAHVICDVVDRYASAIEGAGLVALPAELAVTRVEEVYRLGRRILAEHGPTPPRDLVPIYIRRPEAEEKWEEKHGP